MQGFDQTLLVLARQGTLIRGLRKGHGYYYDI